jgi:thymidylate synthase (FAD)
MKVTLKGFTQDVDGEKNLLEQIAYVARVSNPSNQNNNETAEKLVSYLIKHKHWSPLEMVDATLEIETTRDIARQILRHRSFVFQEFSQRYADPTKDLGFVTREARLQDTKNRQNSIDSDDVWLGENWYCIQYELLEKAKEAYNWAIENGIAKEQARAVLPEGLTVSRMYMKGSIRSWIHYIIIRSGIETQKEHREIAIACAKAIEPIFPMITTFVHNEILPENVDSLCEILVNKEG